MTDLGLGCHDERFRCSSCLCCSICECTKTGFNCGKDHKKSVSPAQMQDGKRYRVIFEGVAWRSETHKTVQLMAERDWRDTGKNEMGLLIENCDMEDATRIEEIGGEQ